MSQLFNMLSRFVIAFLPKSKRLLIIMAAVTFWRTKKIKSVAVSIISPSICHVRLDIIFTLLFHLHQEAL